MIGVNPNNSANDINVAEFLETYPQVGLIGQGGRVCFFFYVSQEHSSSGMSIHETAEDCLKALVEYQSRPHPSYFVLSN